VDVADEESYRKALEMNRTVLQGRKINVRPTRSKSELANIVERTKQIVTDKIKRQKEIDEVKGRDEQSKKAKKRAINEKETRERNAKRQKNSGNDRPDQKKSDGGQSTRGHMAQRAAIVKKHTASKHARPGSGDQKLAKKEQKVTKKERNRRAAIIMARRRAK
jgi:RNA recognition motif-containing protein